MANPQNLEGQGFHTDPSRINKAGKPKGTRNRATIVRELLEALHESGKSNVEVATAAIVNKAIAGDVQAWDKLMDSGFGKIADKQEITGNMSVSPISELDKQMLAQYISQTNK